MQYFDLSTTEVMTQPDVDGVRPYLLVSAGALSEKIDALASLPREVWSSTLLLDADADRVRDVLTQIRIGLEQGFINNGHSAALGRAMSYSSPSAVVREQLSGVDFYLFLRDLLDHFDERLDDLRAKLAELAGRIFVSDGCLASFTGSDEDFDAYWAAAGDLGLGVPVERDPRERRGVRLRIPRGRRASGRVLHLPRPGNRPLD